MMWLAPWALVGLAAVALPVLVHWLARHEADRRPFPTVRFVPQTPPTSVRRHRLTDRPLLAVRAAIVAAAAAARAAPALVRPPSPDARPPRAVVVDTSASVSTRTAADGRTGTTLADAVVTALEPAPRAVVIPADDLREGLAQAAAWLRAQPGAGEATVVSDFQVGAITEADLDVLPASAGRRLIPLPVAGAVPAPARGSVVRVYGAPAAATAARQVSGIELGGEFPGGNSPPSSIVLVFPGAPEAAAQQAQARPLDS
ncbi:MAG: BatA domain-containing protein, partial [Vicinamibacterales bacterium]